MAANSRGHHYVTASYLEGFLAAGDRHLHCYGRHASKCFRSLPVNLARIRDYHSYINPDGSLDDRLEARIARDIESAGIAAIRKLASGNVNLSYPQRLAIAKMIALQSVRVPFERTFVDSFSVNSLRRYVEQMDEDSIKLGRPVNAIDIAVTPQDDPRLIKEWTRCTREDILAELRAIEKDPGKPSRDVFFDLAEDISRILVRMDWVVYFASQEGSFITSDHPVVRTSTDGKILGRGIRDVRSEVHFPLSGTACLQLSNRNTLAEELRKRRRKQKGRRDSAGALRIDPREASDDFIRRTNRAQADHAHRWIFSGHEHGWLVEWMKESTRSPKRASETVCRESRIRAPLEPAQTTRITGFLIEIE